MSRPPPEIELARRLLRQVAPLPGSKERVYSRLQSSPGPRSRVNLRFGVIAACLLVSATAMGVGLHWVTRNTKPRLAHDAEARKPDFSAPRQQNQRRADGAIEALPTGSSSDEVPALDSPPMVSDPRSRPTSGTHVMGNNPRASANTLSNRKQSEDEVVASGDHRRLGSVASLADSTEEPLPVARAPSELSQQVAEYRAAVEELRVNPQRAIERLRTYRSHWPKSSLMHEVDLRIIEALAKLGRRAEASLAARSFLLRYPGSPRAPEIRALAGQAEEP